MIEAEPGLQLAPPFPWFGGKSRRAADIWARLGDPTNYCEPFAGALGCLLQRPHPPRIETVNDIDAYICLAPETRLLTEDLRWKPCVDVAVGDRLIGFDEFNTGQPVGKFGAPSRYRHWQMTTVTAVRRVVKPCYRLTFDDGTTVVASADHLWLGGSHRPGNHGGRGWRWLKTESLVCNRATQRSWILKLCDVIEPEDSYDAGWLAGFFDGEGNFRKAPGWRVGVTQRLGLEADRAQRLLIERGFDLGITRSVQERNHPVLNICINGGMRETLRFLMLTRPERLIRAFQVQIPHLSLYARARQAVGLVAKEFLGDLEVVAITTESHTFVAEGLASHNCNAFRAIQHDPDAVAHYADRPVFESDLHAIHSWLIRTGRERVARIEGDPEYYDAQVAGWWLWGICCWIGSGWCSGRGPWQVVDGMLVDSRVEGDFPGDARTGVERARPHLSHADGQGVLRQGVERKRPSLGGDNAGRGVNRKVPLTSGRDYGRGVTRPMPHVKGDDAGLGVNRPGQDLTAYMRALSDRLRRVRVCCGDWTRVMGPSVTTGHGVTGILLDPPYRQYGRARDLYRMERDLNDDVMAWALEHGDDPRLRIALCGLVDEYAMPETWERVVYRTTGMRSDGQEAIWYSRHCLRPAEAVTQIGLGGL